MLSYVLFLPLLGALALTPDPSRRAPFDAPAGTVGLQCREACFANGLVMRHVGDRMIVSPPLIITEEEIDALAARARIALDTTYGWARAEGLCA